MNDVRYALRSLAKRPGFTVVAVATLALGIGANTAMFSVVNAVLLRGLPFPRAEQLVRVYSTWQGSPSTVSPPDFTDWRHDNTVFTDLAAINAGANAITGDGPAEQVPGAAVTAGFFGVLGVAPEVGRGLAEGDDLVGAEPVAVLGHSLWQRRYGADPGVVGRRVTIEGSPYTVVGVMPVGFDYPDRAELWTPLVFTARDLSTQRGAHYLDVLGRLRSGVTLDRADSDMRQIAARLSAAYPNTNEGAAAVVVPLKESIVGDVRPALRILLGAVGLVLLIACVNLANLLLVRAAGRGREIAVRQALGASPSRLARTVLVESQVLSLLGGVAGTVLSIWATGLISGLRSAGIPRISEARVDPWVLAFALLVSVLTGLLFGLLPSWQASRLPDVARRLREEASGVSGDAARSRTRQALVTAELALALVLLAGAGLLIRSFVHLSRVDLGIRTEGVLTFAVSLPDATYGARERRAAFVDQLLDRLSALPGAESAGATFGMPLTGFGYVISVSELDGRRLESSESDDLSLQVRAVTPDYFPTMGMELVRGRGVASGDRSGTPPVVVVNQTAARLLWPGADPLGRRVIIGTRLGLGGERAGGEVVGVIADVRENGPAAAPRPTMYLSLAQWPLGYLGVAVRTSGEPASLATPIRQAVAALDPDIPIFQVRTLEDLAANAVAQPRLYASVLGLFAFAATLLAVVGVYGVVTRALQQRLREVGIRMALGARPLEVQRLLVRQGLVPVWLGVGIGLVGARALTRLLTRLLFQVGSADPATLAGAAALLVMVAALATYLPAWRATSLDPMAVLRQE